MELNIFQIDAFANKVFEGNPAAVCPLDEWLPDDIMQTIAAENNLSETAFFVADKNRFHIRWFTPTTEVDLCGHATLASAHVLFEQLNCSQETLIFDSRSGPLSVTHKDKWLEMNFPSNPPIECDIPETITKAFSISPVKVLKASDYLVIFENETDVKNAQPDLSLLRNLDLRGVCITAQSHNYDFVSRFFAPNHGIDEDPVTGSAYTQLAPYWSNVLGKKDLIARQVSTRGGEVKCALQGERVSIAGHAVTYLIGSINI